MGVLPQLHLPSPREVAQRTLLVLAASLALAGLMLALDGGLAALAFKHGKAVAG